MALTSGTGISATGTYPNFTITNTAPDQTVALTQGGTTTITGTYPNFTISSADQYVGTVTSVGITESSAALSITGSPVTTSGNINIGFAGSPTQYVAGDGSLVTFPTIVTQAQNLVAEVYNNTGATLTKGTIVYINGGQGNLPTVTKAIATSDPTSAQTFGFINVDLTNNNNGYVTIIGRLENIDTQAFANGTQLYLSGVTAGTYTSTKPQAPIHLVYVAIVVRSHPTQGVLEVKIQNGVEIDEIHDVQITSIANGNILQYSSADGLWHNVAGTTTNIAEGTNLYYTDTRARASLSFVAGSGAYNSTTGVITIPTNNTQITNGSNYITLTSLSSSATGLTYTNTTGAFSLTAGYVIPTTSSATNWDTAYTNRITSATSPLSIAANVISIAQATTSVNGYLSSTDWTTFNNKQATLSLTTTGSSGAATLISNVLNVPTYTLTGLGGVPTSRTLTINGTGYDLSADRSWTIPTSVNATFTQDYTATAAQTTFTVTGGYTVGQLAVYYNGSKLASAEFTATTGTTFVLATACQVNDIVQAVVEITGGGIGGSGTTNYISKWTASGVLGDSAITDNGTTVTLVSRALSGTSATFAVNVNNSITGLDLTNNAGSGYGNAINFYQSTTKYGLIQLESSAANTSEMSFKTMVGSTLATRLFISSAGNVSIGSITDNTYKLQVYGEMYSTGFNVANTGGSFQTIDAGAYISLKGATGSPVNTILFGTNGGEKGRITGNGYLKIANNGTYIDAVTVSQHEITSSNSIERILQVNASSASYSGAAILFLYTTSTTTNNTFYHISAYSGGAYRFRVADSGNVTNANNSYTGISDIKLKENIIDTAPKLNDLLKVRVVNYNLKEPYETHKQIGVIAQELEEIFPGMIEEHQDYEELEITDEEGNITKERQSLGTVTKSVKYSVFVPMLIKAIQELKAEIDELKNK